MTSFKTLVRDTKILNLVAANEYAFPYSFGALRARQHFMRKSEGTAKSVTQNALTFPELNP